jgi:hypothetical protein
MAFGVEDGMELDSEGGETLAKVGKETAKEVTMGWRRWLKARLERACVFVFH